MPSTAHHRNDGGVVISTILVSILCCSLFQNSSGMAGEDFDCARLPPAFWCSCDKVQEKCGFKKICDNFTKTSWNKPLTLTLLYEGLCPGCQRFMDTEMYKAYTIFKSHVNFELVPFGNAKRLSNGTISCQHGADECSINKYESCAIHFLPEPVPFILCLEKLISNNVQLEKASRKCYAAMHSIPHIYDQITHCFYGKMGDVLQAEAAERTASIWPDKHEFVPWVIFNNASFENEQFLMRDLITVICQSIVGDDLPEECEAAGLMKNTNNY